MSKRLLLADNSLAVQKLVEFSLGKEGYEVTAVNDGLSALDLADRVEPDIILSDLNLKGVNVYSFCEKVRRKEKLRKTPILVLINYTDTYDEEKLRGAGVVDFIRKPLESGELVEKVKNIAQSPEPVSERASLENLAKRAPLSETGAPSEDSVKIEELLGWSVAEKSPFSEISDKGEPEPRESGTAEEEDVFVVEEATPAASKLEQIPEVPSLPPQEDSPASDEAILFGEPPPEAFAEEPPIELTSAAEMIPPVAAESFGVTPMEVDAGPEPPIELATADEMTPSAESVAHEGREAPPPGTTLSADQVEEVRALTQKIVEEVVARIAKEVIEKVTWEVVPSLAEIAIRKEIEKLNVPE